MKSLVRIALFLSILLCLASSIRPAFAGRCNPSWICTACTNCSACKHCSQNGGSYSVCRGTSSGRSSTSSNTASFGSAPRTTTSSTNRTTFRSSTNYSSANANAVAAYTRQQESESRRQAAIQRQNQREFDARYASQPYIARCIGVTDGDTIKVLRDRKQIRIRLYGIDAPENA